MPPFRCWNGLTDEFHPTQILADFLTIREHFGRLKDIQLRLHGRCPLQHGQLPDGGLCQDGTALYGLARRRATSRDPALIAACEEIAAGDRRHSALL